MCVLNTKTSSLIVHQQTSSLLTVFDHTVTTPLEKSTKRSISHTILQHPLKAQSTLQGNH